MSFLNPYFKILFYLVFQLWELFKGHNAKERKAVCTLIFIARLFLTRGKQGK